MTATATFGSIGRSGARRTLWAFVAGVLFLATPAVAFKMSPIDVTFEPAGSGAVRSVVLQNPGDTPAAIELTVHARAMTRDGEDQLTADPESFIVIPSQVILMPGTEQVVRLQWLAGPVTEEKAFRLIAEQLPIDLDAAEADGGRLRLLVRYVASLYVRPTGAAPQVGIGAGRIETGPDGGPVLRFTVENGGSAHVGLSNLTITARRGGDTVLQLAPEDLEGISGAVVLPRQARDFAIPLSDRPGVSEGAVTVDLAYDDR